MFWRKKLDAHPDLDEVLLLLALHAGVLLRHALHLLLVDVQAAIDNICEYWVSCWSAVCYGTKNIATKRFIRGGRIVSKWWLLVTVLLSVTVVMERVCGLWPEGKAENCFGVGGKLGWHVALERGNGQICQYLGKGAKNQNGNLRWHLPWRGGGLEGFSSATYLFWKNLESFPDCENVFCT